ncbi:hypothetical protein BLX87_00120 [Bacillus sp. VT-16-64]|nr:hypothetical protein BLX87_00120 [Bacillus sp. VT-16-64]
MSALPKTDTLPTLDFGRYRDPEEREAFFEDLRHARYVQETAKFHSRSSRQGFLPSVPPTGSQIMVKFNYTCAQNTAL